MDITYLDFDLTFEQTEDGYFVRVTNSPAGEAVMAFQIPFAQREVAQFQRAMVETGGQSQDHLAHARALGARLFQAIFRNSVGACLQESYRLAYLARAHLRLRLNLSIVTEFADWPWEYLHDDVRQEFPALAMHTSLLRYVDLMHRIPAFKVAAPLRMLVVISSPGGYPMLNERREWTNLLDRIDHLAIKGELVLERVVKPTLFDLQRQLRQGQYHILHIIGHGVYESQAQEHRLLFEDEIGRSRPVSGQHLAAICRDHFPLRLVVLQACAGAQLARQNPYIGVAQSLVRRSVPAVVALPYPIGEEPALIFADAFYTLIANRRPVDSAVNEARRVLWRTQQNATWGAAVLTMRSPDGQLFTAPAKSEVSVHRRSGLTFRHA
jgi:hypothetical protein